MQQSRQQPTQGTKRKSHKNTAEPRHYRHKQDQNKQNIVVTSSLYFSEINAKLKMS